LKAVAGLGFLLPFVYVSVFPHNISKTDAARITKLDIQMFNAESWKPIYFGVKGKGHKSREKCRHRSLHSCGCWRFL